jgi:hypothetical protein
MLLVTLCSVARGVVIHPEADPDAAVLPPAEMVGAWGTTGSCVAIAPNYVLTAKHVSNGGEGTAIDIAGGTYVARHVVEHPTADLSVVRIASTNGAPANLGSYARPYNGGGELSFPSLMSDPARSGNVAIGGVGKIRGEGLYSQGVLYGYAWADNPDRDVHFGVNTVDKLVDGSEMMLLQADFDGPNDSEDTAGTIEGTPAVVDSGGGWFARQNDEWVLAGISRSITTHGEGESWFRRPEQPTTPDGDTSLAVRVSSYIDWINSHSDEWPVLPGDLDWDGDVDSADADTLQDHYGLDRADLTWSQGDLTGDGRVTFADAWLLLQNYGGSTAPPPSAPEPASLGVLLAAAGLLLRRRR